MSRPQLLAWLVPLAVAGAALGLRLDSAWWLAAGAVLGCGLAAVGSTPAWPGLTRRILPLTALLTAAIAATRFAGEVLWPCPVACAGGAHYQQLWGVPMPGPAVAMLLAIALLARTRLLAAAVVLAWVAAGVSLYFLWLLWRLEMACGFCAAVHAGTLATALLTLRLAPPAWWLKPLLTALGFLGLHFAFHPGVVVDGPVADAAAVAAFLKPAALPAAVTADPAAVARVEARRRLGRSDAPLLLELALDLHCPHCADSHGPLLSALRPAIAAGRVMVVNRFLLRRSAPTGRELALHALAVPDAARFGVVVSVLLGTPEGRGWEAMRSRIAEVADPATLEAAAIAEAPAIAAVLEADAARLRALGCRQTPFAVLSRAGAEIARWQGQRLAAAVIAAEVGLE